MGLLNKVINQATIRDENHLKCLLTRWGTYPPTEAEALARAHYRLVNVVPNLKTGDLMWIFQYDGPIATQEPETQPQDDKESTDVEAGDSESKRTKKRN